MLPAACPAPGSPNKRYLPIPSFPLCFPPERGGFGFPIELRCTQGSRLLRERPSFESEMKRVMAMQASIAQQRGALALVDGDTRMSEGL